MTEEQTQDDNKDVNRQNQIKMFCDLAFEKGIDVAIEEARKLDSPYILDEFHDSLVDELREKLIEKGKLKQM